MAVELKVPSVGESITEVQIGQWLKGEGERVNRDETVVIIETDKVTVELPAPVSGVVSKIQVRQGEGASVGDVIGWIEETGRMAEQPSPAAPRASDGESRVAARAEPPPVVASSLPVVKPEAPAAPPPVAPVEVIAQEDDEPPPSFEEVRESLPPQGFARVMPSARRALKARGLRPEEVTATGPGGRLLKEDVERYAGSRAELGEAPLPAPKAAAEPAAKSAPEPSVKPVAEPAFKPPPAAPDRARESARQEEIVPLSPLRRRVAERLVQAQHAAALLTTFNEVDMSAVLALRQQHQPKFQERYGIKLGLMSFFVKAAIEGLKLIPQLNGEIRGNDVVYRNYYDIGVAVGGGRGLVVPVIRSAERLSFAEVERAISDLAARAKNNQLKLDELQGGTFTISNGGVYGSLLSTPIVNPPQSGILGLHAILDRAVVVDKQIVVRPMMYVALTYDHRLVDGREAVTFLKRIKECVEDPARILIEV